MSNNGDRVVPLRITPDEKLDFWLSSLMSGIQLIRAAIGENTLIAFDPNLNPMRVPYLYGGFGLVGPVLSGLAKPWACVYARCEHLAKNSKLQSSGLASQAAPPARAGAWVSQSLSIRLQSRMLEGHLVF